MGSIEGAYIGISRWLIPHGLHSTWFPLWYAGIPAQNSYPPLLHWLVALWAWATGMTVVHSHHFVTAASYCAAPIGLFLLMFRVSRSRWKSFVASVIYSLISPSAFLIHSVRQDVGSVWGARKLQALIIYGEGPHVTSIALLFFALTVIDIALEYKRSWWTVLAVLLAALTSITNWLGAMSLALGGIAMLLAGRQKRLGRLLLIGVLSYGLAMPWIPPSSLATVRMNAQLVGGFTMGRPQYVYLAAWIVAAVAIGFWLRRTKLSEGTNFAVLFLFFMAVPPFGYEWFHAYPLPQPDRYHLEMDAAIAIVVSLALGSDWLPWRRPWKQTGTAILLCILAIAQIPRWRKQVRDWLPPFDVTNTVERTQALWLQSHFPGQRVFVAGSTRFWFNAFADNPQLGGGFDQGRTNRALADVAYVIPAAAGNGADTVALLKAYGVRAVAVGGKNSRDAYRDYLDPGKYSGVVPELWRDHDDAIYEIPGDGSLAHVVNADDLVSTATLDWAAINRFASAIDRSRQDKTRETIMRWDGTDRAKVQTQLRDQDVLSVQISWDPGWRASVNGSSIPIARDKLGLMVLRPPCENGCAVDLAYTGGTEGMVAKVVFTAALLLCGLVVIGRRRFPPIPAEAIEFDPARLHGAEGVLPGEEMLSKLLALVPPPQKTGRALELQCGMQITPFLKSLRGYSEIRGAEYGRAGEIEQRTRNLENGEFSCYIDHFDPNHDEFPYPDDYFDLVIMPQIARNPGWALRESRRILADGGYLLISAPNAASVTSIARALQGLNPQPPAHPDEHTVDELTESLRSAGFDVEKIFTTFADRFLENRKLLQLIDSNGYSARNRGEQIWCLARKSSAPSR